jgi:hypothetical protein
MFFQSRAARTRQAEFFSSIEGLRNTVGSRPEPMRAFRLIDQVSDIPHIED